MSQAVVPQTAVGWPPEEQVVVHEVRTVLMRAQAFGDAGMAARMDRGMQLAEHFERALRQVLMQP